MKRGWKWRDYLTADEAAVIAECDRAKSEWQLANSRRAGIVNRAIQRAKLAATKKKTGDQGTTGRRPSAAR
jgi:hypothetical protein